MKTNNRLFKGVLILAGLLIALGYGLVFYFRIDEPLFLYHYYDQMIHLENDELRHYTSDLSYITHRNDDRVVIGLEFPEHPDLLIHASEYQDRNHLFTQIEPNNTMENVYGPYSVRRVSWEILDVPEGIDLNEIVLTEAKVFFNDSSEMTTDIGEIHLYEQSVEDTPLSHVYGSASSDGTASVSYQVQEDMTLTSIESPLMNKMTDRFHIELSGEQLDTIVGMCFQEGDYVDVHSEIYSAEDKMSEFTLLDIRPVLTFENESNDMVYQESILNINHTYPHYSFLNLYRYIEARGAM